MEEDINQSETKSIEIQLKEMELEKVKSEVKKINSETEKIEVERKHFENELEKSFWKKESFWIGIGKVLLAVSILTVYINYFVIPMYNIDNTNLKLENAKASATLYQREKKLNEDSVILNANRFQIDSQRTIMKFKEIQIDSLNVTIKSIVNKYDSLVAGVTILASSNGKLKRDIANQVKPLINKFANQVSLLDSTSNQIGFLHESPESKSKDYNFGYIRAYPNPTKNEFTLTIESQSNLPALIVVTNMKGESVFQKQIDVQTKTMFGSNFPPDTYILSVHHNNSSQSMKLIKIKE